VIRKGDSHFLQQDLKMFIILLIAHLFRVCNSLIESFWFYHLLSTYENQITAIITLCFSIFFAIKIQVHYSNGPKLHYCNCCLCKVEPSIILIHFHTKNSCSLVKVEPAQNTSQQLLPECHSKQTSGHQMGFFEL